MAYIYFIANEKHEIKIGYTNNILTRIQNLQVGNSENLSTEYVIEIDESDRKLESHIHGICEKYHIAGEWFSDNALIHLLKHPWFKENMVKVRN